jgi:hypothetical protein
VQSSFQPAQNPVTIRKTDLRLSPKPVLKTISKNFPLMSSWAACRSQKAKKEHSPTWKMKLKSSALSPATEQAIYRKFPWWRSPRKLILF